MNVLETFLKNGWIVGSSAIHKSISTERDIDILIPFEKWKMVSNLIPKESVPNSFGGWRFKLGEYEIDIWPGSIDQFIEISMKSNHTAKALWNKELNIRYVFDGE